MQTISRKIFPCCNYYSLVCAHSTKKEKKKQLSLDYIEKKHYLCERYPENNLFTLRKLIPIEDLERLPAKVVAFFYVRTFPPLLSAQPAFPASGHFQLAYAYSSRTKVCLGLMKASRASPYHPCRYAYIHFRKIARPQPQEANAPWEEPASAFGNNEKIPWRTGTTIADGSGTVAPT